MDGTEIWAAGWSAQTSALTSWPGPSAQASPLLHFSPHFLLPLSPAQAAVAPGPDYAHLAAGEPLPPAQLPLPRVCGQPGATRRRSRAATTEPCMGLFSGQGAGNSSELTLFCRFWERVVNMCGEEMWEQRERARITSGTATVKPIAQSSSNQLPK